MMRAYAIGLGAGTQVLTLLIGELVFGPPDAVARGLLNGAGWAINLALAEWIIRRRHSPPARTASRVRATSHAQEAPVTVLSIEREYHRYAAMTTRHPTTG
jgi:hypothetical protein